MQADSRSPLHALPCESGFTLVEVLAVLIIIAILAAVGTPIYLKYVEGARAAEAQTTIGYIVTAERIHYQKFGKYVSFDDLKKNKEVRIEQATEDNWAFAAVPDGDKLAKVTATSKEGMPGGSGKNVTFTVTTGKFSGYGQDEE